LQNIRVQKSTSITKTNILIEDKNILAEKSDVFVEKEEKDFFTKDFFAKDFCRRLEK